MILFSENSTHRLSAYSHISCQAPTQK